MREGARALVAESVPRPSRRRSAVAWVLAAVALHVGWVATARPDTRAPSHAGSVAVSSESEPATRAGLALLARGGNAVDAAVATALVAGVTQPSSSGLGGGGFAVVRLAREGRVVVLDFRERAPLGLRAESFFADVAGGKRGVEVGTPGELSGLHALHAKYGRLPWADVVTPAARLARRGAPMSAHLSAMVTGQRDALATQPTLARWLLPGGAVPSDGALLVNLRLAATLDAVLAHGADAFYGGAVADSLARTAGAEGGALAPTDLSSYEPREREPLHVRFGEYDVYTMPPPSAGGVLLVQALRHRTADEWAALAARPGAFEHVLAEVTRGALADRLRYVGDPDRVDVPLAELVGAERAAARRAAIAEDRTHELPAWLSREAGTHHLVTADAEGNVVSLTTTINSAFGSGLYDDASGLLLNDELADFTDPAAAAAFGITAPPNAPAPGARPVSSMTPTIVTRGGRVVLALGGSGGMTIAPNVAQVLLRHLALGATPEAAVAAPRFTVPLTGATIAVEDLTPELEASLAWRGETAAPLPFRRHAVQVIAYDAGGWVPVADARKGGSAMADTPGAASPPSR